MAIRTGGIIFAFLLSRPMERATQKGTEGINKHRKGQEAHPWQGMVETVCKKAHVDALTTHDLLKEISASKTHKSYFPAS